MDKVKLILQILKENYTEAKTSLNYKNSFEFLVAVILSARCTDEQVNRVTPALFSQFGNAFEMAKASPLAIESLIKSCGLYKSKSQNLIDMARILVNKYDGSVPEGMVELLSLPGVGRKTANVVRSNIFGRPAIAVDTHVYRVSKRLGLAEGIRNDDVEEELMEKIHPNLWSETHHRLISHGRSVCSSQKPSCNICFLRNLCSQKGL